MRKKILASSLADNYKIIVSGATETGKKHVLEREKNQDAVKTKCYGFGCVMALADGVGSHKFSRFGSRAIVQSVHRSFIDYVKGAFEDTYLAKNIRNHFKIRVPGKYQSQSATTCIFSAYLYGEGLFLGQIGDGLCIYSIDGNNYILTEKEDSFSNIVCPFNVLSDDNKWIISFIPEEKIKRELNVLLLTDGLSEDVLKGKEFIFMKGIKDEMFKKSAKNTSNILKYMIKTWPVPMSSDDKSSCFMHITINSGD